MDRNHWTIDQSAIGRIAVPASLPVGLALFTTTIDFPGRRNEHRPELPLGVVRERFGIAAELATAMQVHGADLARIERPQARRWREDTSCDALATNERGIALGVKIADCLPVTLFDGAAGVVAGIHSGWRGAAARIVPRAIDRLTRDDSFDVASAAAWLGPSIRGCCFEVGEEVIEALEAAYGSIDGYVDRTRGAKPHVDLPGLTRRVLVETGIDEASIDDSGLCTRCDGSIFHSFRRDGAAAGRNLSIAVLR